MTTILLESLIQKYDNSKLNIHFDCKCNGVIFDSKQVILEKSSDNFTVDYDLLIGADGARSSVRNSFLKLPLFEYEQKYVSDDYKTLLILNKNEDAGVELKFGYVHGWSLKNGTRFLAVPQADNNCSCTVIFPRNKNQVESLATTAEVMNFFENNFPEIGKLLPESEAEAFWQRPISNILTIRCSYYHYNDSVLIIGDAAHAVSPSLGQGCNSAFEDVAIFDSLLDEYNDDLGKTLAQFTIRRKPDAHALLELCESPRPFAKILFIELFFRQTIAQILHKLFPQKFPPFLFNMIRETTIPYAEILKHYQNWVSKVNRSNQKFFAR
ncbi:MAG: FAD-dependent oxidoreductase [Trichodesmium sp.]